MRSSSKWIFAFAAAAVLALWAAPAISADDGCSAAGKAGKKALKEFRARNGLSKDMKKDWSYAKVNITNNPKYARFTDKITGVDSESRIGGYINRTVTAPPESTAGRAQFGRLASTSAPDYVEQSVTSGGAQTAAAKGQTTLASGRTVTVFSGAK